MALINCPECNKEISDKAQSCPNCGNPMIQETEKEIILEFTETKLSDESAEKGCLGFFSGSAVGGFLIIFGGLLSLTGIGALIGVPMIIVGLIAPFAAPMLIGSAAKNSRRGPCPHCASEISSYNKAFDCPLCKKRVLLREDRFYKA